MSSYATVSVVFAKTQKGLEMSAETEGPLIPASSEPTMHDAIVLSESYQPNGDVSGGLIRKVDRWGSRAGGGVDVRLVDPQTQTFLREDAQTDLGGREIKYTAKTTEEGPETSTTYDAQISDPFAEARKIERARRYKGTPEQYGARPSSVSVVRTDNAGNTVYKQAYESDALAHKVGVRAAKKLIKRMQE